VITSGTQIHQDKIRDHRTVDRTHYIVVQYDDDDDEEEDDNDGRNIGPRRSHPSFNGATASGKLRLGCIVPMSP